MFFFESSNICYNNNITNNSYIKMLKKERIWINWKKENDTKIPYQPNGRKASTTDQKTWSTYAEVEQAVKAKGYSGVGIVFEPTTGVIGIDFDHCVKDEKVIDKTIASFVKKAETFCEYSPSGTGLHLLFKSTEPIELERNKHYFNKEKDLSVEIYTSGRYFTFTNDETPDSQEIRTVTSDQFLTLIKELGYPWKDKKERDVEPVIKRPDITEDDTTLLKHIFGSKNGATIEKLYNGDASEYNNDASGADFALCMHLAFWTGKDPERIRKLWLESPLGQREKTQKRVDYQNRTIDNAVTNTKEVYTRRQSTLTKEDNGEEGDEYIMTLGQKPIPMLVLENICRILERDSFLVGKFRLNDFSHMTETIWDTKEWVNLFDGVILEVQRYISNHYVDFARVSKDMVTNAILSVASMNKVNPPREYFKGLVWDKKPRLNSWLHHTYGVDDNELNQAMGANWIKGMVKRTMQPGCIFDEVLALESQQGWRKSTSIRVLGQPWHVETTHLDDKDFYMIVAQNIIVEFSEGEIFDRSSVKKIKAEVTKTEDQFRPPYERGMIKFKRSCVFAVTTNLLELKDDTGNRRWLPVQLEKIADIEWLKENRDQIFAEAYHRAIVVGETTYEYPKKALEALQHSRSESTPVDETVLRWYVALTEEQKEEGVSLGEAVNMTYPEKHSTSRLDEITVASALKRTLFLESKNTKVNGAVLKRWKRTERTDEFLEGIDFSNELF